ncbi:MAG TPA: molybdopterin-dependent oxidoreductase, partial [Xanthomonadales bacterium]|nr:molybdopterin-dependent oxidoreductase [Xanthomonadales bacterium]
YHHLKGGRILRSVPRDNEATNETWLSDRDRYSQQGLYAADRVMQPMIKANGEWQTASWDEALKTSARLLRAAGEPESTGLNALMSPNAGTEEHFLAQHLVRELGGCIDHRLREQDFSDDATRAISPAFEMTIAQMQSADAVLLVGCNPRHEAPILGHRLRKAWQSGGRISAINPLDWEFIFDIEHNIVAAPQYMLAELAGVALAVAGVSGKDLPSGLAALAAGLDPEARHQDIAEQLQSSERGLLMLGQFAMNHHEAGALRALAKWIAGAGNCALNLLPFGVNSVGAWMAGAVPHRGPGGSSVAARNTAEYSRIAQGSTAFLWDLEPEFDVDNPGATVTALKSAKAVIAVSVFATESLKELADVILPLAPLAESEGSIVNLDGERMNYAPAGKVQGEARPGWKILRWLGDHLGFEGFSQVSLTELQTQVYAAIETQLAASSTGEKSANETHEFTRSKPGKELYRVGEVPMFSTDPLCRRATALQETIHAQSQFVGLNPADAGRLGLIDGGTARVRQNDAYVDLPVTLSDRVPAGAAWVRSAICSARELGSASGIIGVELA